MRWPFPRRRKPYQPLPPIIRQRQPPRPATAPATSDIERQSRDTASRIERSTNDLMLLLAELERRKESENRP